MLSVVIGIVAFAVALLCYWGFRTLGRKAYEAGEEAMSLRRQNFESVDEQRKVAIAKAFRYSSYARLCETGAWLAGATAFVAVIYPFLQL